RRGGAADGGRQPRVQKPRRRPTGRGLPDGGPARPETPPGGTAVTEAEWLASVNPGEMLPALNDAVSSHRKLSLALAACVRRCRDGAAREAVEAAEAHADKPLPAEMLARFSAQARPRRLGGEPEHLLPPMPSRNAAHWAASYVAGAQLHQPDQILRNAACAFA